ncbi:hypothetical protein LTR17_018058 [Elasticomyces elasticus]|nr:hypothetical protein LTR17_018058 [Elasticomyces elasticus]
MATSPTTGPSTTNLFSSVGIDPGFGNLTVFPPEIRSFITTQATINIGDLMVVASDDNLELILQNNATAPELRGVSSNLRKEVLETNRLQCPLVVLRYHGPRELSPRGWLPTLAAPSMHISTSLWSGHMVAVAEIQVAAAWSVTPAKDDTVEYTRIVPRDTLNLYINILATAQAKEWPATAQPVASTSWACGATYTLAAHLLRDGSDPSARCHFDYIDKLMHRMAHPSNTFRWVHGPAGAVISGLTTPSPLLLSDWVYGQVQHFTDLLYEVNFRASFHLDSTSLLELGGVEFTHRHCRLCFDLVSFFRFLTPLLAQHPELQRTTEAAKVMALATAYSLDGMDLLEHSAVVALSTPDDCALESCPCHVTSALGLDWRSQVNPVHLDSFGWVWHGTVTKITFRHALSSVDDNDLNLPALHAEGKRLLDTRYGGFPGTSKPARLAKYLEDDLEIILSEIAIPSPAGPNQYRSDAIMERLAHRHRPELLTVGYEDDFAEFRTPLCFPYLPEITQFSKDF